MESTVFLVRHGRPALPDTEMRFLGRTDLPLSPEGVQQAEGLRRAFWPIPLEGIFHSGLRRAAETAEIIGEGRNIPLEAVPGLQEVHFGTWELLSVREVMEQDPEGFEKRERDYAAFCPPGGESFHDAWRRAWPAFNGILTRSEGNLLIAAHAGIIKTLIYTILEIPWRNIFSTRHDYCGVHVLERFGGRLTVRRLNWAPGLD